MSILLFKQNKIRSLTDFSTKKPALRENISLFYLFLFFKNKNILWILLQCSWCDILNLSIFRRRLLLHTSAQKNMLVVNRRRVDQKLLEFFRCNLIMQYDYSPKKIFCWSQIISLKICFFISQFGYFVALINKICD